MSGQTFSGCAVGRSCGRCTQPRSSRLKGRCHKCFFRPPRDASLELLSRLCWSGSGLLPASAWRSLGPLVQADASDATSFFRIPELPSCLQTATSLWSLTWHLGSEHSARGSASLDHVQAAIVPRCDVGLQASRLCIRFSWEESLSMFIGRRVRGHGVSAKKRKQAISVSTNL